MMMRTSAYTKFEEICGELLANCHFQRDEQASYSRQVDGGEDKIMVDQRGGGRFVVFISHFPEDLEFVYGLSDTVEPRGFPAGPYLGFLGVSQRECAWSETSLKAPKGSQSKLLIALEHHGLPWLENLRVPSFFASQVDRSAILYAAVAFERAGCLAESRNFYELIYARLRSALSSVREPEFIRIAGKRYAFVAHKLGRDADIVAQIEERLGWAIPSLPRLKNDERTAR